MKHYIMPKEMEATPEEEVKFLNDKAERDRICAEIDERIARNTEYCKKHGDPLPVSDFDLIKSSAVDLLRVC